MVAKFNRFVGQIRQRFAHRWVVDVDTEVDGFSTDDLVLYHTAWVQMDISPLMTRQDALLSFEMRWRLFMRAVNATAPGGCFTLASCSPLIAGRPAGVDAVALIHPLQFKAHQERAIDGTADRLGLQISYVVDSDLDDASPYEDIALQIMYALDHRPDAGDNLRWIST